MFICGISPDEDVLEHIHSDELQYPDPDDLDRRIREGWIFHTRSEGTLLFSFLKARRATTTKRTFQSPFCHPLNREQVMDWVNGQNGGDPFVRFPRGSAKSSGKGTSDWAAHEWVQAQLYNLGLRLNQGAVFLEYHVDGGRVDVVWDKSKIAWEVDLSEQTRQDQELRAAVRAKHGLKMISLVDTDSLKASLAHVPTICVRQLASTSRARENAPYAFNDLFVDSVFTAEDCGSHPRWVPMLKLSLRHFCRDLAEGRWAYARLPRHPLDRASPDYGFVNRDDLDRHRELVAECDARRKTEEERARSFIAGGPKIA